MNLNADWIVPDWPAPANVRSLVTTRAGGVSAPPFDSMNLALHVNDEGVCVHQNRDILAKAVNLPAERIHWLNQVHGTNIIRAEAARGPVAADGIATSEKQHVCAIMTADCLPVLMCDKEGGQVAAVHAGWRGMADGIILEALRLFDSPKDVLVWLGPAIGPDNFEVGPEVREAFCQTMPYLRDDIISSLFCVKSTDKYLANLYELARMQLRHAGVSHIYGGDYCTYQEADRFYSYRRDGQASGRMATLIWKAF